MAILDCCNSSCQISWSTPTNAIQTLNAATMIAESEALSCCPPKAANTRALASQTTSMSDVGRRILQEFKDVEPSVRSAEFLNSFVASLLRWFLESLIEDAVGSSETSSIGGDPWYALPERREEGGCKRQFKKR